MKQGHYAVIEAQIICCRLHHNNNNKYSVALKLGNYSLIKERNKQSALTLNHTGTYALKWIPNSHSTQINTAMTTSLK